MTARRSDNTGANIPLTRCPLWRTGFAGGCFGFPSLSLTGERVSHSRDLRSARLLDQLVLLQPGDKLLRGLGGRDALDDRAGRASPWRCWFGPVDRAVRPRDRCVDLLDRLAFGGHHAL